MRHIAMRTVFQTVITAAVLALAACSSPSVAAHLTSPSATPAGTYSNGTACKAFHQAITKGVPASATGANVRTWLRGQTGSASPELQAAIRRFVSVWNNPADMAKISSAQQEVRHLCQHA